MLTASKLEDLLWQFAMSDNAYERLLGITLRERLSHYKRMSYTEDQIIDRVLDLIDGLEVAIGKLGRRCDGMG